jgi:penicillin-binding protein 2
MADPKNHFPLLDRATQGLYPPGSTFKLFTSVAALEDKITTPEDTFNDDGCVQFGDKVDKCNAGKAKHGIVNLEKAIRVSSDVYFYNLGYRFWNAFNAGDTKIGYGIQNMAKEFGFGKQTGIGLPNEARGRIPDKAFKQDFNRDNPDPFTRQWLPGDSANVAVGQGDVLVTPIQLASGYAAFANGGSLYAPRLADKILTSGHQQILRNLPKRKVQSIPLPKDVHDTVLSGLLGAVNAEDGTARPAFSGYQGCETAGKTGTAQSGGDKQDNALFVAIVNPTPSPDKACGAIGQSQYVVAVIVEEGGFGGSVAAPIARRIIDGLNDPTTPPADVQYRPQRTSD